ncbi:hypothetical protein Ahy_B09g098410 isoform B [Arachis hypogaea]|uniref:Protein FAR1-RELATED SEQUENCE n=1 Tax=Arachis hypogaea TaxID=3818 RepID=A0A444XRS4_ARAHY|nr:hypothetical protein Ahy_B09g098410 isoform B [Arachis hypogaea]
MMLQTRKESSHVYRALPSRESFRGNTLLELRKKADCVVRSTIHQGDSISVKVDEQKIVWEKTIYRAFTVDFDPLTHEVRYECNMFEFTGILCCYTLAVLVPSCYVLPRLGKNVMCKHTYIRSSHDMAHSNKSYNLFSRLYSEFYNVAQEFVTCNEEAAILRSALWEAKSKLTNYCASICSNTVAVTQNSMPTQSTCGVVVRDMLGPLRVATKGQYKSKRLGVDLDKSIKKIMRKKKRNSHPVCARMRMLLTFTQIMIIMHLERNDIDDATVWNASDGGRLMSLLNSFGYS